MTDPQEPAAPTHGSRFKAWIQTRAGLVTVLVAALVVTVAVGQLKDKPSAPGGGSGDVRLVGCGFDGFASKAQIQVTNSGRDTADYWVKVEFLDANRIRMADRTIIVNNVRPGQTAMEDALGITDNATTCSIVDVDRI